MERLTSRVKTIRSLIFLRHEYLLDEFSDDVGEAITQFTLRRKPDAHALVELSDYAFPMSGKLLFLEFLFRLQAAQFLHQLFPLRFLPSLFQLVSETTVPYAEILNLYKDWISKVKQANQKSLMKRSRMSESRAKKARPSCTGLAEQQGFDV